MAPASHDPEPKAPDVAPVPDGTGEVDALADALASLGTESETERAVKRVAPWIVSAVLHAGLIVIVLLVAGTAVLLRQQDDPILIIADFDRVTYDPLVRLDLEQDESTEKPVQERVVLESFEQTIDDQLNDLAIDPVSVISDAASESALPDFSPEPSDATAEFVGISTSNARRLVYVIDASGSMIPYMRRIVQELARSLDGLSSRQSFALIFFQSDDILIAPPANKLAQATPQRKLQALEWIEANVVAMGGTNPTPAIEKALSLDPDAIFLLSQDIRGYGEFEVDQQELLAMLDRLNPVERSTGRRKTVINCIQFAYEDELQTMRKIAEQHGGPRGYKFLDKQELGL